VNAREIVSASEIAMKAQAAKNFARTALVVDIGNVKRSSILPERFSSDHRRMPVAGMKKRNVQGRNVHSVFRLA
jgi:hypothetical protein